MVITRNKHGIYIDGEPVLAFSLLSDRMIIYLDTGSFEKRYSLTRDVIINGIRRTRA